MSEYKTKAIIFDFFEVLFLNASGYFFKKYIGGDEEMFKRFVAVNNASDRGELDYEQRIQALADVVGKSYDFVHENLYKDLHRNEELFNFIGELKSQYKIGLLSNTGAGSAEQFFPKEEAEKYFDDIVLSYEVNLVKPDPAIFTFAAERLGVKPSQCIFVDDSAKNCEAAKSTGMRAIVYTDFNTFKQEIEGML
ncbi:MAG TPA: HAD family phosphatase [Candidatus Saccharibacteria bacterium]|nr:HAD family phosphatase [Candidatus Saccharibacteria bacterium]